MSKDTKKQEQEASKSNKKYIILALVVILAIIGIMSGNGKEDETATTAVATIEQAPVAKQISVAEETPAEIEPTVARIDISTPLVNADEPQFEVYVDGSETPEKQAGWMRNMQLDGYVIQRDGSGMEITIKVLNDADLTMNLRGPDTRDENGNRYASWVKYTSVTINGEEILPEPVSVWHNQPFRYIISAKAGDEITIGAKWYKYIEK